jgi:hypothetical protein
MVKVGRLGLAAAGTTLLGGLAVAARVTTGTTLTAQGGQSIARDAKGVAFPSTAWRFDQSPNKLAWTVEQCRIKALAVTRSGSPLGIWIENNMNCWVIGQQFTDFIDTSGMAGQFGTNAAVYPIANPPATGGDNIYVFNVMSEETASPTTAAPTTVAPTTASPTTANPTTANPTTASPTTTSPTTVAPTTATPTSATSSTATLTTANPTTVALFTGAPTAADAQPSSAGMLVAILISGSAVAVFFGYAAYHHISKRRTVVPPSHTDGSRHKVIHESKFSSAVDLGSARPMWPGIATLTPHGLPSAGYQSTNPRFQEVSSRYDVARIPLSQV